MYKSQHKITYGIGNLDGLTAEQIGKKIDEAMENSVIFSVDFLTSHSDKIPYRSGVLRADHIANFNKSRYDGSYAHINLDSQVPYAARVNQFEDENVQHSIDPQARGHYQIVLKDLLKKNIKLIWDRAKMAVIGI